MRLVAKANSSSTLEPSPLTLSERVEACCAVARKKLEAGDYDAGCAALQPWWTLGEWPRPGGLSYQAMANLLLTAGMLSGLIASSRNVPEGQKPAEGLLSGALALFELLGESARAAEARIELAYCYYRQGLFDFARATLRSSIHALSADEHELKAAALIRLAIVERHAGRPQEALDILDTCAPIIDACGSLTKGRFHNELANMLQELGAAKNRKSYFERALNHYREALLQFEKIGNRRYMAAVENNHSYLLLTLKRFDEGQPHLEHARRLFEELGDGVGRAQVDETFAQLYLASGKYELAEHSSKFAVEVLETSSQDPLLADALSTQGLILCRLGRPYEGRSSLEHAQRVAERCGYSEGAARPLLIMIEEMCERLDADELRQIGKRLNQLLVKPQQASTRERIRSGLERIAAVQTEHERRRKHAEAASRREALVNKLSVAIHASQDLKDMLETTVRELGQVLSAARVQVRLYDATGKHLSANREYVAPGCESLSAFEPDYDDLLREHLFESQKSLVFNDASQISESASELVNRIRSSAKGRRQQAQIHCPLILSGEFRGVISGERIHHWDDDEVLLIESVAAQLAADIAQAELFEMVARGKKEWESTFDAMSDGVFIFDRNGRLIRVNRAGAAMDNASTETLLGKKCCDILRTSTDGDKCIVEQALHHQTRVNVEITPQNLNRPVLVTVEPVLDEQQQTVAAVCTARDLSELRQAEAVAREGQSLLKNILESARESIYALDVEGRYKWCNQAMVDLTGYKLEEIIGHTFLERTHEDDREMRRARFAACLAGKPQTYESRYITHDGSVRYASVNTAPIVVDGQTTGVLGIAHDITEQKQERERAARADKLRALGQLASGVAHDFNNSLAAILGRAQLILRRVKDEELIRSLGIIVTAAEDAAATVRRIQTFARKSLGSELELLDVGGLLRDAIEITRTRWENEARAAGLSVEVTLNAEPGSLTRGSPSELREVFVNLIVNAVDAMPEGGKLTICCQRRGNRLRLRFADTGTGMKEEVRERVFEPFYTTKGVQGTGLGLAVSYGIVERHEGSISVESNLGQGTTFYVDLPVAESTEPVAGETRGEEQTASLSVLVIDDEPFVRETLAEMLSDLDHRVVTADCGRDALAKVRSDDFDLVFTDLAMPEMDGWETAREIRKHRPELPIVLVTGYGATAQPPSGELDLVADIISKPFDFAQVTGTIGRVCNGS